MLAGVLPSTAADGGDLDRYRRAVDAHEPEAYYPLAEIYADGRGVARNPIEAYALAELAEHFLLVTEDADQPRAIALKTRLAARMTHDEISAALQRASILRPDLERQRNLGAVLAREIRDILVGLAFVALGATLLGLLLRHLMFRSAR